MATVQVDDGAVIRYEARGEGPAILMLQGVGVAGCGWRPQVEALANGYRTVTVDNRGIGASSLGSDSVSVERMARDACAVMDDAGIETAHVVGHSLGGLVSLLLALDAPERVRSLSLLCTFADGRPVAAPRPWVIWIGLRSRIGTRRMRRRAFLEMLAPASSMDRIDRDALCAELADVFGRDLADQPAIAMKQVQAMGRCDVTARLRELSSKPTLVVSGDEDRLAAPSLGRAIATGIDGARYHELKAAAHALTIQRAGEVNVLLAEHLKSA